MEEALSDCNISICVLFGSRHSDFGFKKYNFSRTEVQLLNFSQTLGF